jgi:hypothetical protein
MVKNYLFGEATSERVGEAQQRWSSMKGILETGDTDDIVVKFLRHFLVVRHGAIRDKEILEKIKEAVAGPRSAITYLDDLADQANIYTALQNHQHPHWYDYGNHAPKIRRHILTLNELNVEQIRPLMLACVKKFKPAEIEKSFRLFISWAVRLMVYGSPTGTVEKYYAGRAVEVWEGEAKTAKDLVDRMKKHLPDDDTFKAAFAQIKVSKSHLARYYLRSLERTRRGDNQPELIVNDDQTEITLEHILPENPAGKWGRIDQSMAEPVYRRLGNMVLLRMSVNSVIGNVTFEEKKKAYEKSAQSLLLTQDVTTYPDWNLDMINLRQAELAKLAAKTWPITPPR